MIQAEKLLGRSINRQWDRDLVRLYGLIRTQQPGDQIRVCEEWVKTRSEDPDLLTALARLYLHAGNRVTGSAVNDWTNQLNLSPQLLVANFCH